MRRLIVLSMVVLFLFLLSACGHTEPVTIYQDEAFTATRHNRALVIQDAQTGAEYNFTLHRVRRSAEPVERAHSAVETEQLRITTFF